MDAITWVRVIVTIVSMMSFLVLVWWAYRRSARPAMDQVAQSIIDDDDTFADAPPTQN